MKRLPSKEMLPNLKGIYSLTSIKTGRRLIGQTSRGFRIRIPQHLRILRLKCHYNTYLQNHYNKYGEEDFKIEILEITDDLNAREVFWIDYHDSTNKNKGFNLCPGGSCFPFSEELKGLVRAGVKNSLKSQAAIKARVLKLSKPIRLFDPRQKPHDFSSVKEAARCIGVHKKSVQQVIHGRMRHAKNWTIDGAPPESVTITNGTDTQTVFNVKEFCRQQCIEYTSMLHMLAGRRKHCRGWKLVNREIPIGD